jgi:hypothetical protein
VRKRALAARKSRKLKSARCWWIPKWRMSTGRQSSNQGRVS